MDINALLSPYGRSDGGATAEAPLKAAVSGYLDAIEETDVAAQVEQLLGREPLVPVLGTEHADGPFDEIAAFEPIDLLPRFGEVAVELTPIEEPEPQYVGRHRAEIAADSVSPLVPVVATHRLSA